MTLRGTKQEEQEEKEVVTRSGCFHHLAHHHKVRESTNRLCNGPLVDKDTAVQRLNLDWGYRRSSGVWPQVQQLASDWGKQVLELLLQRCSIRSTTGHRTTRGFFYLSFSLAVLLHVYGCPWLSLLWFCSYNNHIEWLCEVERKEVRFLCGPWASWGMTISPFPLPVTLLELF